MNLNLFGSVPHVGRRSFSPRRSLTLLACATLLPLNGCLGHHYVKADFKAYETAFAETSNRELLLNLARLENRDPAYFFKMGQITSGYRMQASLTANGQLNSSSGAVQIPVGGGSPGAIFENDPTFQFIPVNDDTNARLLMAPIQPETFYALYQQGWRLDQLFRLLVDRIEVSQPSPDGHGCSVEIFRNTPPLGVPNADGTPGPSVSDDGKTRYNSVQLSHYVTFLRVSALVYDLQKSGILVLRGSNQFVPYDANSYIPITGDSGKPPDPAAYMHPSDQDSAASHNDLWEPKMNGSTQVGWILGHKVFSAVFYLSPIQSQTDASGVTTYSSDIGKVREALETDLRNNPDLSALNSGPALEMMLKVMGGGFSLEGSPNPAQAHQDVCPAGVTAHLYMRSIIELMAASAQEEIPFRELMKDDPLVPPDPQNPLDRSTPQPFRNGVPRVEQMPVLRLQWHGASTVSPLVTVSYRDKTYSVTDAERPGAGSDEQWIEANATWNRDMFRLIEGLSSQVTVDISKFPLPEILQLHSD